MQWAAQRVDEESIRERPSHAQGELFNLDGDYALGDNKRIAKAAAQVDHMRRTLAIDDANLEAVRDANTRKHEEFARLLPYYDANPGITKAQAVAMYQHGIGSAG